MHRWVLRDDNSQQCDGGVRLSESPLHLELHWKPDARGREQLIGLYRLDLARLLEEDYVQSEGATVDGDFRVRVRFHRGDRGVVSLQSRADGPTLAVGTCDMTL